MLCCLHYVGESDMNITVTLPWDPMWTALDWVKEHCPSYISNDVHMDGYNTYDHTKIDYFFSDQRDAVIFALRWA
jgi:hypothetical protein